MIPIAIALLMSDTGSSSKSLSDVSKILADLSKGSAIAVTPNSRDISVASDIKLVEDLTLPLKKEGFATWLSEVAVIYQLGIPTSHLGVLKGLVAVPGSEAAKPFKEVTIPASAVKDNLITFETKPGEAIKVSTLMNMDLTRRIMVSPYYTFDNGTDFPLAMNAKNMAPSDFVKALARGLSGKLVIDAKTYTIAFDAANFRSEMMKVIALARKGVDAGKTPAGIVNTFNGGSYSDYQEYQDVAQPAQSNSKEGLSAALTLLSSAINQMNDQLLEQTFAYKGTSTRLNLATFSGLQESAINYLKSATPAPPAQAGADVQRSQGGRQRSNLAMLIPRVNAQSPGRLIITTDFRVALELNLMSGRPNRNGASQSVDAANTITIQVL